MSKDLVIFGTGSFAEVVCNLFRRDSDYNPVAFTANEDHIGADTIMDVPVVPFESVEKVFPPSEHAMFIAVGYKNLNKVRARICQEAKSKGYPLATYISSRATYLGASVGENTFIFEDNTIQPFVKIGNDVILWSGNHIGHHTEVEDHCFITSHVVVSGNCRVGKYCFIGVNATLRDGIEIGDECLIGSGALIMKSTQPKEVYIPQRTKPDSRTSDQIPI